MVRRIFVLLALLGLGLTFATGVAQAHTLAVSGNAVCNPETGQYDATWTITTGRVPQGVTGSYTVTGAVTANGPLDGNGSTSFYSTHAPNTGQVSIHVVFAWSDAVGRQGDATVFAGEPCVAQETTTTVAETTTTTVAETTTTTTPAETTTTAPLAVTTTVPTAVAAETTVPVETTAAADTATSLATTTTVAPTTTEVAAAETLPYTGSRNLVRDTIIGVVLILGGVALATTGVRRYKRSAEQR